MSHIHPHRFFYLLVVLLTGLYGWGLLDVPFHPDESTQIFMSTDVDLFWQAPSRLFWDALNEDDLRQRYRQLDAPLTRTLIGVGRALTGQPALAQDWDWSKTWEANHQAGALPDDRLLWAARLSVAWLFPFTLVFAYHAGRLASGRARVGWLFALLLAGNALVLLHTRRAMAESALLCAVCASLWVALRCRRSPWLLAIPVGLAFCAKQSGVALLALAPLVILWPAERQTWRWRVRQMALFVLASGLLVWLFNPFLWAQPVTATGAAIRARQDLLLRQMQTFAAVRPDQVLVTPAQRVAGTLAHLYFTPPAIADVGNYRVELQQAEQAYLANPVHVLLRNLAGGGVLLGLTLWGLVVGVRAILGGGALRRPLLLILVAGVAQAGVLIAGLPLPFQRYSMPLLPFVTFWIAYGLAALGDFRVKNRRGA